jgi:SnoaL-like domain
MSKALADLMERNLLEVFGQVDSARRAAAIAQLYTEDCTFFEAEEEFAGREALNAKVGAILKGAPGLKFHPTGPAQINHNVGRLHWQLGPAGAPPAVTGMDIAIFERGRIRALYTFLDKPEKI